MVGTLFPPRAEVDRVPFLKKQNSYSVSISARGEWSSSSYPTAGQSKSLEERLKLQTIVTGASRSLSVW